MTPLSLSDTQLSLVQQAATLLSPGRRDGFLRSIANRLCTLPHPTDHDVQDAVNVVLGRHGIAGGTQAFTNQKQRRTAK
jgi:hypothetical protein